MSRDCKYEHNKMIMCSDQKNCTRCGWNPTEARRRAFYIERHRSNEGMLMTSERKDAIEEIVPIAPSNRAIPLLATNLKTGERMTYKSMKEAERTGKFRGEGIRQVLIGGQSHHRGWKFERAVE